MAAANKRLKVYLQLYDKTSSVAARCTGPSGQWQESPDTIPPTLYGKLLWRVWRPGLVGLKIAPEPARGQQQQRRRQDVKSRATLNGVAQRGAAEARGKVLGSEPQQQRAEAKAQQVIDEEEDGGGQRTHGGRPEVLDRGDHRAQPGELQGRGDQEAQVCEWPRRERGTDEVAGENADEGDSGDQRVR